MWYVLAETGGGLPYLWESSSGFGVAIFSMEMCDVDYTVVFQLLEIDGVSLIPQWLYHYLLVLVPLCPHLPSRGVLCLSPLAPGSSHKLRRFSRGLVISYHPSANTGSYRNLQSVITHHVKLGSTSIPV